MRVPLSWLREYVDFDLAAEELVELFSLRSQEVDGLERLGVTSGEVVVGEVIEFGSHPNADRLSVARVDLGGQEVQIVAGAPNPYPGARVPVILPGSTLADGRKLDKAKLRGLESYGMMMSERELGISNDHEKILLLDGSYEVGRPLEDYFPVGETILEIDVMPNRPDLWGMIGVARELAAILKTTFRIPEPQVETGGRRTREYDLRVEAEDLCPRYDLRRVSDIRPGGTAPLFMRRRIYAAGMRSINTIVDATNYVMLETGQPIHAFDATKVQDGIVVRRASPGEEMTLLDGQTRVLDEEMLVIADEKRGLVVAGVMGAEEAEVGEETTDVLIEVATFAGRNILETSQRLGLRTDASGRFERGLDPNMVSYAMGRVTGLIAEICGGSPASDTLSHYPDPVRPWQVPLRLGRAELLLGMPVEASEATQRLELLGCKVQREDGKLSTTVPTFRRDLRREADLIEEVGRLVGLENVPERLPGVPLPGGMTQEQRKLRRLRHLLADLGFAEIMTYPFGPARWNEGLNVERALRLRNPLSAEASNLRISLLPGLLDVAARNRSFGARGGAFFEIGRVFEPREQPPELREAALRYRLLGDTGREDSDGEAATDLLMGVAEAQKVTGLYAGTVRPSGWNVPALTAGFFEAKGLVERLIAGATFEPRSWAFLHPGRAATVLLRGVEAGWVGELHPEAAERFGLEGWPVSAFELDLAAVEPDPTPHFELFYNVPAVSMDLAVLVDEEVRVGDMLKAVAQLRSSILADVRVFDVYVGPQVPAGKKSVAFNFTFQAEKTLTDAEAKEEIDRISERLREAFGAEVRGG
ncbi:MAG TPA: phenylalanine--tRNA ligase subunit beta [Rubrobacteraceae bacterium]|nr:phenylalanine--tRNA ligase subunit beta [Rubrobacteraceae bacterium]